MGGGPSTTATLDQLAADVDGALAALTGARA
jgi:hypothetical protein